MDAPNDVTAATPSAGRRWLRRLLRLAGWGLLVLVMGGVFLLHAAGGQRLVVDTVLARLRGALAGELTVEGVRSRSLLFGATLTGIRLTSGDGRPFLEVDSAEVSYSLLGLLRGRTTLAEVALWTPRVRISTYPGEEAPNVSRLLRDVGEQGERDGPATVLRLGEVTIRDGSVEILSPMDGEAPEGVPTVPLPDGDGVLRRLALEGLQGELEDAVVRVGGDGDRFTGDLRSIAVDVRILQEPLRITDGAGTIAFGDRGLTLDSATVSLPGSELEGGLRVGPDEPDAPWRFTMDARVGPGRLADLAWLDPRFSEGSFTGRVEVAAGGGVDVVLHDVHAQVDGSTLDLDGGMGVDGGFVFRDLTLAASPITVSYLESWVGEAPLDGWITGRLTLDGPTTALRTDGRVTLVPTGYGGRPTTADVRGTVHLGSDPGVTNFGGRLDPLNFSLVQAVAPRLPLTGRGAMDFQLSGRMGDSFRYTTDIRPQRASGVASRVTVRGSAVKDSAGAWVLDAETDVTALGLDLVREVAPALELQGSAGASLTVRGPLRDLVVTGDVDLGGGTGTVDARFDATTLASGYRAAVELEGVDLSAVSGSLPAPTVWSGSLSVDGRGLRLDSLDAAVELVALGSRVGGLHVDTVTASARAAGGLLSVDTLFAVLGGVRLRGTGSLGLVDRVRGEANVSFETEDLLGLRPVFMGDRVIARDTLTNLERMVLQTQGVDADTLPRQEDVRMSGSARGEVSVVGSLDSFSVDVTGVLEDGVYRSHSLGRAEIDASGSGLPARTEDWALVVDVTDVDVMDRRYEGAHVELNGAGPAGRGWVELRRTDVERYGATGGFSLDSLGGRVDLELATFRFDSLQWRLARPTAIRWDPEGVSLEELEMVVDDGDAKAITASGRLSRSGESDFTLDIEGLRFNRLARFLQFQEEEIGGLGSVTARVVGPARTPSIDATLRVEDPRYGDMAVGELEGELHYADRSLEIDFDARSGGASVLAASGTVPVDLSLASVDERVPTDRSLDVQVRADSLEARDLLARLSLLEDVSGWVSGDFNIRGTLLDPEPSGALRLQQGAWTIPALGVRHSAVAGLLTIHPDRRVEVAAATRAGGVSDVTGNVVFRELTNPELDLTLTFQRFQAVERLDVTGRVSGSTRLTGSYARPVVQGSLSVDEGTLFLEEFARNAQVVDLTDPRLLGALPELDTLALGGRPLLSDLRNPFLENLRVDVELAVPRNTWLRSPDMNVEIGGELSVTYDRIDRDLVLVGDLEALRGSYSVLGRRFEVRSGTVGFIGVPGINPTLDIEAVSRVRMAGGGDALDVTASVTGTLVQPRVTLSSEEQGLAEADLVSYLIFGRPTHQLAESQASGAVSAAASRFAGTLGTALGTALAQGFGVDYLSITQAGDITGIQNLQSSLVAGTQVEIGQYISDDVFIVVVFRPRSEQTSSSAADLFGARVEWALTDNVTAEGFVEDRFLRSGFLGGADLGQQSSRVVGVFVFREWGY